MRYADRSPEARRHRDALIVEMTADGTTVAWIAATLGVCTATVVASRRRAEVSNTSPRPLTADEVSTAQRLLNDGASYAEVGRTLDRDRRVIARRLPGYGWSMRERDEFSVALRMHGAEVGLATGPKPPPPPRRREHEARP